MCIASSCSALHAYCGERTAAVLHTVISYVFYIDNLWQYCRQKNDEFIDANIIVAV